MIFRFLFVCLVFFPSFGLSQWDAKGVSGVGTAGIADTTIRIGEGNPGSISTRDGLTIAVGILPGLFELRELRRFGLAVSLAGGGSGMEIQLHTYGGDLFSVYRGSFGIATSVGPSTDIGLSAGISEWRTKGYTPLREWDIRLGGIYSERPFRLGGRICLERFGSDRPLPSIIAGASVRVTEEVELGSELHQEPSRLIISRYTVAFRLIQPLLVQFGWQDEPQRIGGGLSLMIAEGEVAYGVNWHSVLGWTHGLGLVLQP